MLSLEDEEAGKSGGITLGSINNKPVAWMYEKPSGASKLSFVQEKMLWDDMKETPLYTHPVKELTDEEIQEVAHGFGAIGWMGDTTYDFARAILRKAQGD
jgi:hypothetical protein